MNLHRHHRASKQTQVSNLHVQTTAQTQEWAQEHFTSSLWLQTTSVAIIRRRSNYDDVLSQGSNKQQRRCMENMWLSQMMLNTESQNQITVFHPHKIQKQVTTKLGFSSGKDEAMEDISFPDSTRNVFYLLLVLF